MEKQLRPYWAIIVHFLMLVICYLPLLYLVTWYSYVTRVWIGFGYPPPYPPKTAPSNMEMHGSMIYFTLAFAFYSVPVFLLLLFTTGSLKQFYLKKVHYFIYIISIVLVALHLYFDPLLSWFLD